MGLAGSAVFAPAGGQDVLATLSALSTALTNNDVAGINTGVGTTTSAQDQIISAQATLGTQSSRLTAQQSLLQDAALTLSTNRSKVADADPVESLSAMADAQQTLSRTLDVSARVLSTLSLVDKM